MLLSLPNILTLSRIAAIPLIAGLCFAGGGDAAWWATWLFAAACVTDWLDGHLARLRNETSAIGRFLDPIADKLLVGALLMAAVATGRITGLSVLPAVLILMREILVSGLREFLAPLGVSVPVSRLAKWKTALQMVALGGVIVMPAAPVAGWIGLAGLWAAAALTLVSGWAYLNAGLDAMLAEGRPPPP